MKVSMIIPAYNEAKMIMLVLEVAKQALAEGVVNEVLVVDDGSVDNTKEVAEKAGFRVIRAKKNLGKAGAMVLGVKNTSGEILLFWDADLIGSQVEHFRQLTEPLQKEKELNMVIGKLVGQDLITFVGQTLTPQLSGERAIKRSAFDQLMEVDGLEKTGFAIELVAIKFFKENKLKYLYVNLFDITIIPKEQKEGLKGFRDRLIMYKELLTYFKIDVSKRKVKIDVPSDTVKIK